MSTKWVTEGLTGRGRIKLDRSHSNRTKEIYRSPAILEELSDSGFVESTRPNLVSVLSRAVWFVNVQVVHQQPPSLLCVSGHRSAGSHLRGLRPNVIIRNLGQIRRAVR